MKKNELFGGMTLKADDLRDDKGKPAAWVLTISGLSTTRFKEKDGEPEKEKRIAHFSEIDLTLVLNKTNWETIEKITEKDDDEEWVGHKIELYPTKVQFGPDMVDAIRIRPVGGWPEVKAAIVPGSKGRKADPLPPLHTDDDLPF